MANLLGERMARSYRSLEDAQMLDVDTSLVKSYFIENQLPGQDNRRNFQQVAQEYLDGRALGKRIAIEVDRPDDSTLLNVLVTVNLGQRLNSFAVYLDLSDTRYWLLHSMGRSSALDYFVDRLILSGPELDRAWLPADLLEAVSTLGSFRGLSLDYDRTVIPDVDFADPQAPPEMLKMQLWGNRAAEVLAVLRAKGAFPNQTTLAKVKVKYSLDDQSRDSFSLDDVKFNGKVTARGTSFESHSGLLTEVHVRYSTAIETVEHAYRLTETSQSGFRLGGAPLLFELDPPVADLEAFCRHVFSARPPFRLWGVPLRLGNDYFRVEAVDLHVGHSLTFELTSKWIRMYLRPMACGNTVVRFYTNLQHHYNSRVRIVGADDQPLFDFQQTASQPMDRHVPRVAETTP